MERLPDPPFEPMLRPVAVNVGDDVVVIGYSCTNVEQPGEQGPPVRTAGGYSAAVFDVSKNRWRQVRLPQGMRDDKPSFPGFRVVRALGATSDHRAVFELGETRNEQYWTYSPSTDVWQQLPAPTVRSDGACLAGDTLVVMTAKYLNNGKVLDDLPISAPGQAVSHSTGDGWVQPTITTLDLHSSAGWTVPGPAGDVNLGGQIPQLGCLRTSAMVFDPRERTSMRQYHFAETAWSTPTGSPVPTDSDDRVWTGKELVFLPTHRAVGNPGPAYDPATDTWRVREGFPPSTSGALWSGSAIVGYTNEHGACLRTSAPGRCEPVTIIPGIFWYPIEK